MIQCHFARIFWTTIPRSGSLSSWVEWWCVPQECLTEDHRGWDGWYWSEDYEWDWQQTDRKNSQVSYICILCVTACVVWIQKFCFIGMSWYYEWNLWYKTMLSHRLRRLNYHSNPHVMKCDSSQILEGHPQPKSAAVNNGVDCLFIIHNTILYFPTETLLKFFPLFIMTLVSMC